MVDKELVEKYKDCWFTPEINNKWKTMAKALDKDISQGNYIVTVDPASESFSMINNGITSILINSKNIVQAVTTNYEPLYILPSLPGVPIHSTKTAEEYCLGRFGKANESYFYAGFDTKNRRVWSKQKGDAMVFLSIEAADNYARRIFPTDIYLQCCIHKV